MKSELVKLTCGVADVLKPFSFTAEGEGNEPIGYEIELCRALVSLVPDVTVEFKRVSLADRIPAILSGEVDFVMAGLGFSEERAKTIGFTSYYYHLSNHTLAKFVESDVNTIGFIKGSSALGVLKAIFPDAVLVEMPDGPTGFRSLKDRKIDAFAASEVLLASFIGEAHDVKGDLHLLPPLKQEEWAIGLRQQDEWLKEALDEALVLLEDSGEAQKIWDKWFGPASAFNMERQFRISKIRSAAYA